ncbi:unnamed protein product, partial [Phaeothamnion confervicola]
NGILVVLAEAERLDRMSVSIKVGVRCRPFTIDDLLGVHLVQNGDDEGEVNLLHSDYSTNRFAFTYAWWSAYGWERHAQGNDPEAAAMTLINQEAVYEGVGQKIKADLYEGNAVVLFAYGLSGSGKTFTVFGPDAVDIPEAWFKHATPHPLWGIFPRLAYELFQDKKDGWKVSMKYFQNVVDIVRDLMSPLAQEQHYKNGMKKDADGFVDIDWCSSQVLTSWDDLRTTFQRANANKAIAPTQFNHQSTRGHCIMTLEVEMPHPEQEGMKQRGRVYVCDLAGTEPAGDIVFAKYEKHVYENGEIEHKYLGPHEDQRRTKELQSQGMKINLSLSEMAQFFMKMAEAVQKKKLKPGASIPGCNSYFLCKFLKDTMLQARTYLFCAIRPEVKYHQYTFSTLGFAKNASVVKLQPKKATMAATPASHGGLQLPAAQRPPAERKLMAELEQMKAMFEQLARENEKLKLTPGLGGDGDGDGDTTAALAALLAAKQAELANVLEGGGDVAGGGGGGGMSGGGGHGGGGGHHASMAEAEERSMMQQREEYGRRGIHLSYYEKDTKLPHLVNLDEDPFRSNRFVYLLEKPVTAFGPSGDIRPLAMTVVRDHCCIERRPRADAPAAAAQQQQQQQQQQQPDELVLVGGKGETFHNGKLVAEGQRVALSAFDRIALGGELLLLRVPGGEGGRDPPPADEAVEELQRAIASRDSKAQQMLEQRMREFEEEKQKWAAGRAAAEAEGRGFEAAEPTMDAERERAWQGVDREILDVLPKVKEAKKIVRLMDRDSLAFDVALQRAEGDGGPGGGGPGGGMGSGGGGDGGVPRVRVKVEHTGPGGDSNSILLDPMDFLRGFSVLKDELVHLRTAKENGREYTVDPHHDPITVRS